MTRLVDLDEVLDGTVRAYVPVNESSERAETPVPKSLRGSNLKGGRQLDPDPNQRYSVLGGIDKRPFGRDANTLSAIKTIRDLDPQAAHAVWNFLRLVNPGHHLLAVPIEEPTASTTAPGDVATVPAGQLIMDDLAGRVAPEYGGGLDQLHNILALALITNGAVAVECAPTAGLDDTEDWYPIDPRLIYFRRNKQSVMEMGQKIAGKFTVLNREQVFYYPLDPDVDDPYGRPPLLPAISATLSKAQLLNDLRAVAHNQGYPRIDVVIDWEQIKKAAPPQLLAQGQEQKFREWASRQLDSIAGDYTDLNVDDTFVHFDWVKIGMVGPNYAASSFDFRGLEQILTRSLQSSLKTLPILLGINDSTSETHGSIQWQIQVAAVLQLQRCIKRVIEKCATLSLRLGGVAARGKMVYDEIRAIDRKYEADAAKTEADFQEQSVRMGWTSNDDAAQAQFGHPAVKEPILDAKADALAKVAASQSKDPASDNTSNADKNTAQKAAIMTELLRGAGPEEAIVLRTLMARDTRVADLSSDEALSPFEEAARAHFMAAKDELLDLLAEEGYELRDTANDVSDQVFGLGYSRRMKGLLRDAVRQGMLAAGLSDPQPPANLVDRIWEANRPYVRKIRDELREALRAGLFRTLTDVDEWFLTRSWREVSMGRFLGKQGLNGGWAFARGIVAGARSFVWMLGPVETDHCSSCKDRDGLTYSYEALVAEGFPGSDSLDCGSRCHCTLDEAS